MRREPLVTNTLPVYTKGGWNVGTTTGYREGRMLLTVFRVMRGGAQYKTLRPVERWYPYTDEGKAAADRFCLERGYLRHYRRDLNAAQLWLRYLAPLPDYMAHDRSVMYHATYIKDRKAAILAVRALDHPRARRDLLLRVPPRNESWRNDLLFARSLYRRLLALREQGCSNQYRRLLERGVAV